MTVLSGVLPDVIPAGLAECAALARALETATRRADHTGEGHDLYGVRAAIRMASEEPGPGQMDAPQAKKHIAVLQRARRISPSRSGGAQRIRELQGTRRPTSGPNSQRRSQTPVGWSGWGTRTGWKHARCRFPGPSHNSSEGSWRKSG